MCHVPMLRRALPVTLPPRPACMSLVYASNRLWLCALPALASAFSHTAHTGGRDSSSRRAAAWPFGSRDPARAQHAVRDQA